MMSNFDEEEKFILSFHNRVIEHLGIKLYQNKPTNVVAEFVSNAWDADATKVSINLKASLNNSQPEILISDNGRGMTKRELINDFLVIARNCRTLPTDKTNGGRLPMGRKGIGKLAGFGIARVIDVLSYPNSRVRMGQDSKDFKFYWLRFHLDKIIAETNTLGEGGYYPDVIANGIDLEHIDNLFISENVVGIYEDFKRNIDLGEGGVCIRLHNTTLKKNINPDTLLKSLANRFTVTMLRPDFIVAINSKTVKPEDALPKFHNFSEFGTIQSPIKEYISCGGIQREVKYWVQFVSLEDFDWPLENAGIGVYAHGKIAQDRPFFFGVKGKEIFSRYLYGVIEADWLDEMPDDVVSTDRRSIDWETDATADFYSWGAEKLSLWIETFRKWRIKRPRTEIIERIRKNPKLNLYAQEEDALAGLLSEVLPSLGNNEVAKDNAIDSITAAWIHQPMRQLTQSLWNDVYASVSSHSNSDMFATLIDKLKNSLVPESMGLAVTVAQRIAAITAMRKLIDSEKTETHLQKLIEEFPWLLGPQWEKLTANQTIKTLVETKHKPDIELGEWKVPLKGGGLKPDFVFLTDGPEKEIVVFELKGPESGKTLQPGEYLQLVNYLNIIESSYPNDDTVINGILVGHSLGGFRLNDKRIEVMTWNTVLTSARNLHVSYLASLLKIANPLNNDARIHQIADFGGAETMELLNRLVPLANFSSILTNGLNLPKINKDIKHLNSPSNS